MVLPARRFRSNDMVISKEKITHKRQNADDDKYKCVSNVQDNLFGQSDFAFYDALKVLCDGGFFGAVYLLNGIKLEGYFCDYDDEVVVLKSPDNVSKQMVYHHAIATLQIE